MENQIPPIVENKQTDTGYFKDIPLILLLIFGWFSYGAFSNLLSIPYSLYYLSRWWTPSLEVVSFLLPIPVAVLYFAILWGLVKQRKWTKFVLLIWYIIGLIPLVFLIYPILNSVGYNSRNEFYYLGGLNAMTWIAFLPTVITLAINTAIIYYLNKKAIIK